MICREAARAQIWEVLIPFANVIVLHILSAVFVYYVRAIILQGRVIQKLAPITSTCITIYYDIEDNDL